MGRADRTAARSSSSFTVWLVLSPRRFRRGWPMRRATAPRRRDATCADLSRSHLVGMSNEEILVSSNARWRRESSDRSSRGALGGGQARGPVIDQDGREIPAASLHTHARSFRLDFRSANLFGNLTRDQRLARVHGSAKVLDLTFLLAGTLIRYGVHGII